MKIVCSKMDLLTGLNIAIRAVPTKTTLPILENFLIIAEDNITIITNDNDMGIETIVKGRVDERGSIAVDAKIFGEIVRKLPDGEITISADANFKVNITCPGSEFNLNGSNPAEFPELPETENQHKIQISHFSLKELIRQTIFSISQNENNPMMKGELFEIDENVIQITSLDSHRISIRREILKDSYPKVKVIVPGKVLNEISRILSGEKEDMVELIFDNKFIKFTLNETKVISRLIEGEFFNVQQMISSDFGTELGVSRIEFMETIDRASTLSRENEKKPVILEISDAEMKLAITSSLGHMDATLPISKKGDDLRIGFNPKFFMDVLKAIDDEEIYIYFVNANAPCFIKDKEYKYIYVILPININQ